MYYNVFKSTHAHIKLQYWRNWGVICFAFTFMSTLYLHLINISDQLKSWNLLKIRLKTIKLYTLGARHSLESNGWNREKLNKLRWQ